MRIFNSKGPITIFGFTHWHVIVFIEVCGNTIFGTDTILAQSHKGPFNYHTAQSNQ